MLECIADFWWFLRIVRSSRNRSRPTPRDSDRSFEAALMPSSDVFDRFVNLATTSGECVAPHVGVI